MASQYCGYCKDYHEPRDGYYWGPTWNCYMDDPPDISALKLAMSLDERVSRIENLVWAIARKLDVEPSTFYKDDE